MRIFLGLTEIAGYYRALKAGFDQTGVKATFVDLSNHRFQYKYSQDNSFLKLISFLINKRNPIVDSNMFVQFCWRLWRLLLKVILFIYAIGKYDVFIFGFNSSFFHFYDLPVLKLLNKIVIYHFHGGDCRPPYLSGGVVGMGRNVAVKDILHMTAKKKQMLTKIERYSDIIISHPLFSHFLEKPFISSTYIGIPCVLHRETINNHDYCESNKRVTSGQKIRVLHCPSNPQVKGTEQIRSAVRNLKRNGFPIQYIEITQKPNSVVLTALSRCDFIVDQLYSDTPMSGFAAEAAFFQKPAIVGGYAKHQIDMVYPSHMKPPSLYCHPDNIETAIKELIENEELRIELGKRAKEFIENHWTSVQVAERYLQVITNHIPKKWWYDPNRIEYVQGAGLAEQRVKEVVSLMLKVGGEESLQLSDKKKLKRKLIEFGWKEGK